MGGSLEQVIPRGRKHSGARDFKVLHIKFGSSLMAHLLGYLDDFTCVVFPHIAGNSLEGILLLFEGTYITAVRSSGASLSYAILAVRIFALQ